METVEIREIQIPHETAERIKALLTKEPQSEEECFGEDNVIEYGATFGNAYQMAIQICGVQYEPGNTTNLPWTQAVLFDDQGRERCCTEVGEEFFGEWELTFDGNTYKVIVTECCQSPRAHNVQAVSLS